MAGAASAISGNTVATPNSFGSVVNNGQLVGVQTKSAYRPINWGGGVSAVPSASPLTIPPSAGYGMPQAASSYGSAIASVPGVGSNDGTNRGAYSGPFVGSPAMYAFVFMTAGLLWLRYIHWRK